MVGMLPPEMEWSGHDGRAGHGSLCWSTSDASGSWGCGAFTSAGEWFQLKLPETWEAYNVLVVGEHIPGRGGQCIGSGGTHTRQGWTMYW